MVVSTLAGFAKVQGTTDGVGTNSKWSNPFAITVGCGGVLYVADAGAHTIRTVTTGFGGSAALAGSAGTLGMVNGAGTTARFNTPTGVAASACAVGAVYVTDAENHLIRVVTTATGSVTTLAGGGSATGTTAGWADGTGTRALFNRPYGLALDSSGNLLVSDKDNNLVRWVNVATAAVKTIAGSTTRPLASSSSPAALARPTFCGRATQRGTLAQGTASRLRTVRIRSSMRLA